MERLLKYFKPEKYTLDINIDKHVKTIGGKVVISGEAKDEIIKLHAEGLEIDDVRVGVEKANFETANGILTLEKVPRGALDIEVVYHGSLNENMEGAYLSTYEYSGCEERIVATQFESHYAREAFPCIDEPAAKAIFELTITVPDEDDLVISNMPALKSVLAPNCMVTTFEPTPRMSTYLLAWVIGKFHGKTVTNKHGVEITTYCALNQDTNTVDFANDVAAQSLVFYDDSFGVPYPLKRCVQVALPDFEAGAMENWGLVTYRESMLLAGGSATLETKKSVALTVAHELSHQWFGDLVTMEGWDDLWLNESFASVMEYFAVDAIYPEYKIWEGFFTGDALAALRRDCLTGVQSVHQEVNDPAEIATLFDPAIVYAKSARLMLMVIRLMGWENFCAGAQDYFKEYQYKNTCGDDLWAALRPHANFDVGEMMHAFIDRPGYPVVKNEGTNFDKTSQRRFLLDGEMKRSDWPLMDISEDMSGHYVLELSNGEFDERLTRFESLGLEEKLRLLIDRDLLARAGLVSSASLVPLIWRFREEANAAVWSIIFTIVSGLKIFFDPESEEEKEFKEFVGKLVAPKLMELGFATRDGDDENTLRLRSMLLAMDFYAEDANGLRNLASAYDDDCSLIDAEIRDSVLSAKIYLQPEMLDKYLEDYKKTADPEIKSELLAAATSSKDVDVLERMIGLLNCPDVVKPQDQFYLFIWLYRNPVAKERVFSWLTVHWEYVESLVGDKSIDNYPRYTANLVRTEKEFELWREFFEPMKDDSALARAIEVGENEIKARLGLIAKDKSVVQETIPRVE